MGLALQGGWGGVDPISAARAPVSPDKACCVWLGGVLRSHLKELCVFFLEILHFASNPWEGPADKHVLLWKHFLLLLKNPILEATREGHCFSFIEIIH